MGEEKKSYFIDRTLKEIKELDLNEVSSQSGLVKLIDELDKSKGLIIPSLIPQEFYIGKQVPADAARKTFKHGDYLGLSQPKSQGKALASSEIPLQIRARDFGKLHQIIQSGGLEQGFHYLGYSFRPVQGRDRQKRLVPFVWIVEGARLFSYAMQKTKGIEIQEYTDSMRANKEGASVVVEVPSRTKRARRYKFKLEHVPTNRARENLATVLSLRPALITDSEEPRKGRMAYQDYNIRYTYSTGAEQSNVVFFTPHDIAGYFGIIRKLWNENYNMTPLEMCPFVIPSKHQMEFYKRINNNLIVRDLKLDTKEKLRKPYIAEKSILLGRATFIFGNNNFAYCDHARDGKLESYNEWIWNVKS